MTFASTFDTHKAIGMLEKRGLSRPAAEGITNLLKEVIDTDLVSKRDLERAVETIRIDVEKALHRQTWGLVGIIFAQGAFIIAILQMLA